MITLESSKLFNQLPAAELSQLKQAAREVSFAPGQDIFKAGDPGDGVYVVKSGSVRIAALLGTGERHVFSRVPPGDVFGEMTLLDDQPRSAFATAEGQTEVYFVPRAAMVELLKHSPELSMRLVREISQRLREFNQQYVREVVQAERLAVVGRFASTIVHDLKNPLSIISVATGLMAMPETTGADRIEAEQRVATQIERITNLVNDILDFTRGGPAKETYGLVDYGEFVQSLVAEFQPELRLKDVHIELGSLPPAVSLPLNPKRLGRVFYNLFLNAVDAMPGGGKIILRFKESPTEITTEIEDTGPGIAPEVVHRLFEAFATFGKAKGTGLGLAIAQRIVEEHRGKIWARNQPGSGAVFAFTLPRERT